MLRRVDHPPDRSKVLRVSHALGCSLLAARPPLSDYQYQAVAVVPSASITSHLGPDALVAATVGLPLVRRQPPETARLVSTTREPKPSKESITTRLPANHDRKRSRAIMQWAI